VPSEKKAEPETDVFERAESVALTTQKRTALR
jgi:hypothetical protein